MQNALFGSYLESRGAAITTFDRKLPPFSATAAGALPVQRVAAAAAAAAMYSSPFCLFGDATRATNQSHHTAEETDNCWVRLA